MGRQLRGFSGPVDRVRRTVLRAGAVIALLAVQTNGLSGLGSGAAHGEGKPAEAVRADGRRKINLAGRQRMLSQRIGLKACLAGLGIEPERHAKQLEDARALFARTLKGFRDGDAELGLLPVTTPEILDAIEQVDVQWAFVSEIAEQMIKAPGGAIDLSALKEMLTMTTPLLLDSDLVTQLLEDHYSDDGMLGAGLASAINIAGRQRMLSQKMSKELCMIALDIDPRMARALLAGSISLFESSRDQLAQRLPALQLPDAQRAAIEAASAEAYQRWSALRPLYVAAAESGAIDGKDLATMAAGIDPLLTALDRVVQRYEGRS